MKARLLVLVVAAACALGGAASYLTQRHGHPGGKAVTFVVAAADESADLTQPTDGWWDWH
ncbi:MAG: hypothetical protein E6G08_05560 [Actinobacteria bacterium]|nr:MAG: hypothetical protein E6G08_05560 [Actinomycetota bacterium]